MIIGSKIRHYIGGKDLGQPRNGQDVEITVDFLNKKETANINLTDLDFVLEANGFLQKRALNGTLGGVGIFEGEPYQMKVGDPFGPVYTFEGYLDFTDDITVLGGEEISVSLKKLQGEDWLNEIADSFSFAYLASIGKISSGDYVRIPYIINYVPDGLQLIVLSMSIYMMTKEIIENVVIIAETIADVTDAATPVIGAGAGLGAVAVVAWDLGNFILVILKTIARIVYVIAITVAIVALAKEVLEQLLPAKRNHLGMSFRKMFERACAHKKLIFQSSIRELEWVHIPQKSIKGGEKGEVGHPTNSDPIDTFGDLIRVVKEMFNADFRIVNGRFLFERKDSFEIPSSYKIPKYFGDQERLLDRVKFNTDEIIANYNINWQFDTQDQNTLDDQEGRIFQAITTPIATINSNLVNIKNLAEVRIPFSLGKYKGSLTAVEKVAKTFGSVVDAVTGIFGGGTNFEAQIKDRIGSLLLSSHFLTIGKVVKLNGSKIAANQRSLLSATELWDKYHFINSFAEVNGRHNQYFRHLGKRVPMTLEEFAKLIENNILTDDEGNRVVLEKMVYSPEKGSSVIDYRLNKKYTNNLKIEYVQ